MPPGVTVLRADLADPAHVAGIVACLEAYARDPMGGEQPLGDDVTGRLGAALAGTPSAMAWLAREGEGGDGAAPGGFVGVVVAFANLSTFAAAPRWNVHDVAVNPAARGRGVGRALLERVLADAAQAGAVAVSLEVRHDNAPARHLYASLGFGDDFAPMDFWVRKLP